MQFAKAVAAIHDHLAKYKIPFLVAIPPSNSTINRSHLPRWVPGDGSFTEYDLALKLLAARGVRVLDLRPAMQSHNFQPTYYRTDSHWNYLGAMIARNEILRALGYPEREIDIRRVFRGFHARKGGDMARLLGVASLVRDEALDFDLSSYPHLEDPRVLVIADSFVGNYFPSVWANGGHLEIMGHSSCHVEIEAMLARNPSVVVLATNERILGCFW